MRQQEAAALRKARVARAALHLVAWHERAAGIGVREVVVGVVERDAREQRQRVWRRRPELGIERGVPAAKGAKAHRGTRAPCGRGARRELHDTADASVAEPSRRAAAEHGRALEERERQRAQVEGTLVEGVERQVAEQHTGMRELGAAQRQTGEAAEAAQCLHVRAGRFTQRIAHARERIVASGHGHLAAAGGRVLAIGRRRCLGYDGGRAVARMLGARMVGARDEPRRRQHPHRRCAPKHHQRGSKASGLVCFRKSRGRARRIPRHAHVPSAIPEASRSLLGVDLRARGHSPHRLPSFRQWLRGEGFGRLPWRVRVGLAPTSLFG